MKRFLLLSIISMLFGCFQDPNNVAVDIAWYQQENMDYHIVQQGDSIYSIAFRYSIDYRDLAEINELAYPYKLIAGKKIKLESMDSNQSNPEKFNKKKKPIQTKKLQWIWPLSGKVLKSFSIPKRSMGIDIQGKMHQKVIAASDGVVAYSGHMRGYGNLLIIKHTNEFFSAYGHNSRLLVREGARIKIGQEIATLGANETNSPYLHFEIRLHGKPVNPLKYLPKIN